MAAIQKNECALVMLDVLGFKDHLNGPSRLIKFTEFMDVVAGVNRVFHAAPVDDVYNLLRNPNERTYLFSDTLLYTQMIENEMTAGHAVVAAATFVINTLYAGLEHGFLMRGAISVGEVLTSSVPEAIAGPVVIECAQEYERSDWAGCHLTPSAAHAVNNATTEESVRLQPRIRQLAVPFKQRSEPSLPVTTLAVEWVEYLSNYLPGQEHYLYAGPMKTALVSAGKTPLEQQRAVKDCVKGLLHAYGAGNPMALQKIANTVAALRL